MRCPYCGEDIKDDALLCKHCHQVLLSLNKPLLEQNQELVTKITELQSDLANVRAEYEHLQSNLYPPEATHRPAYWSVISYCARFSFSHTAAVARALPNNRQTGSKGNGSSLSVDLGAVSVWLWDVAAEPPGCRPSHDRRAGWLRGRCDRGSWNEPGDALGLWRHYRADTLSRLAGVCRVFFKYSTSHGCGLCASVDPQKTGKRARCSGVSEQRGDAVVCAESRTTRRENVVRANGLSRTVCSGCDSGRFGSRIGLLWFKTRALNGRNHRAWHNGLFVFKT